MHARALLSSLLPRPCSRGISVIDVYAESLALFDGHVMPDQSIGGGRDCLHYCRPGFGEVRMVPAEKQQR